MEAIFSAWGRILSGYTPALSIEITRECPLRCPGCYAYGDGHLGGEVTLREVRDFKGQELVDKFMEVVDRHKPLHVSIVGGEPLVRYCELDVILPMLSKRGIHAQLVTSAVREIPKHWRGIFRLSIVVSIDGLQPEHDVRRRSRLQPVWLHRVGGPRSRRAASALRLHSGRNDLQRLAEGRPAREASASGRALYRVRDDFSLGASHDRKP